MKNLVNKQVLNQLTQQFSQISSTFYNTADEATYAFYQKCIDAVNSGYRQIYKVNDNDGYVEEHFSDGHFTIMLVLDIDADEVDE